MRLRQDSELGWLMLQLMGALCMPSVTRDAVLAAPLMQGRKSGKAAALRFLEDSWPRADTDREAGTAQPQTRSPGPALMGGTTASCARCGWPLGGMYGAVCMDCDVDPQDEMTTSTYSTTESLWWLSYADDQRCAGVAIVRVTGAQTTEHAADVARALELTPPGQWQVMGLQVPEEERATAEPYAGRFLTTAEAVAAFAARSIKSWEEEHPAHGLHICNAADKRVLDACAALKIATDAVGPVSLNGKPQICSSTNDLAAAEHARRNNV